MDKRNDYGSVRLQEPGRIGDIRLFKRICIIERNTNESFRDEHDVNNAQPPVVKKLVRSTYKVEVEKRESSDSESETICTWYLQVEIYTLETVI